MNLRPGSFQGGRSKKAATGAGMNAVDSIPGLLQLLCLTRALLPTLQITDAAPVRLRMERSAVVFASIYTLA